MKKRTKERPSEYQYHSCTFCCSVDGLVVSNSQELGDIIFCHVCGGQYFVQSIKPLRLQAKSWALADRVLLSPLIYPLKGKQIIMQKKFDFKTALFALIYAVILCFGIISVGLYLGSFSLANAAQQPPDPTEQFHPFFQEMTVLLNNSVLTEEKEFAQRRKKVMAVATEYFDFQEMSKRVLGKTWKTLSKAEQQHFATLFTSLLEYTYLSKIESYSDQEVKFKSQRIRKNRAQVVTNIVAKNGSSISVAYNMILKADKWKDL